MSVEYNKMLKLFKELFVLHCLTLSSYGEEDNDNITNYGLLSPWL